MASFEEILIRSILPGAIATGGQALLNRPRRKRSRRDPFGAGLLTAGEGLVGLLGSDLDERLKQNKAQRELYSQAAELSKLIGGGVSPEFSEMALKAGISPTQTVNIARDEQEREQAAKPEYMTRKALELADQGSITGDYGPMSLAENMPLEEKALQGPQFGPTSTFFRDIMTELPNIGIEDVQGKSVEDIALARARLDPQQRPLEFHIQEVQNSPTGQMLAMDEAMAAAGMTPEERATQIKAQMAGNAPPMGVAMGPAQIRQTAGRLQPFFGEEYPQAGEALAVGMPVGLGRDVGVFPPSGQAAGGPSAAQTVQVLTRENNFKYGEGGPEYERIRVEMMESLPFEAWVSDKLRSDPNFDPEGNVTNIMYTQENQDQWNRLINQMAAEEAQRQKREANRRVYHDFFGLESPEQFMEQGMEYLQMLYMINDAMREEVGE